MGERAGPAVTLLASLPGLLGKLEAAYKDIHAHPELSMREHRTATITPALRACTEPVSMDRRNLQNFALVVNRSMTSILPEAVEVPFGVAMFS